MGDTSSHGPARGAIGQDVAIGEIRHPRVTTRHDFYAMAVSSSAALGGLLFGFDIAVVSGTVPAVRAQFHLSHWLEGLFVASALIGCIGGSLIAGVIGDHFGRKKGLLLASALFIATGVGCALAPNAALLLLFRFIGGLGIGVSSMICPLYISEVSPARIRGRMIALFQFTITVGICISLFTNAGLQWLAQHAIDVDPASLARRFFVDESWRAMFGSALFPALAFALAVLFVPESPRWLMMKGAAEGARQVLSKLEGEEVGRVSLREIQLSLNDEGGRFADLLRPGARGALLLIVSMAIASQFSGVTVVLYYGPDILNRAGVRLSDAINGYVLIGLSKMIFTSIALWLVDSAGRRPLLLWGGIGCFATLISLGTLFALHRTDGLLLVGLIATFCAFYAFSLGPIKWIVMSEIFPTHLRARAITVGAASVWLFDAVVNYLFPWARDRFGAGLCFFAFAVILLPQIIIASRALPETKRRTLEEIGSGIAARS